jgi:hypothetical protein
MGRHLPDGATMENGFFRTQPGFSPLAYWLPQHALQQKQCDEFS